MPSATDAAADDAQLASRLARNAVDSLPAGALAEKLGVAHEQRRALRVKLGIDPTAPDIHLGHAVLLRKLREFQDAGHRAVLIVGDFTSRVGDPSGRSSMRPVLSEAEIQANAATFNQQALRILDPSSERLEVRYNSEWLQMPLAELLALMRTATAAQLLERDDFSKRLAANEPLSMLELLYPLLQSYDSVAVRADVELGGTDQKFNLLLGRDVQRAHAQPPQAVLTMPMLVGTDGHRKMSKSLGNQIGVTDPPNEIYGKTMAIPDEAIDAYRRLLVDPLAADALGTPAPPGEDSSAEATSARDSSGGDSSTRESSEEPTGSSPRDAKRALARELVRWLYSAEDAAGAERHFDRVFVERELPETIEDARFQSDAGLVHLPGVMAEEFAISRSEARRLIDQGAVTLGDAQLAAGEHDVSAERAEGQVLRVGRRRFRRLRAG
jgi:tyrosyl-tRNA synthetase